MASKSAHLAVGAACGLVTTIAIHKIFPNIPGYILVLCFLASIPGGTAPDWLEIASWSPEKGRQSIIKHRTYTHWFPFWCILTVLSIFLIPVLVWSPLITAFGIAGISHLIIDWPNPMGVPWIRIKKRHSLKLWKSGEYELILVMFFWFLAGGLSYLMLYGKLSTLDNASAYTLYKNIMQQTIALFKSASIAWNSF